MFESRAVARWDGYSWNALGSGLNDRGLDLTAVGPDLYIAGWFTNVRTGCLGHCAVRWDGSSWHVFIPNDDACAIAAAGRDIYVGSDLADAGGNANADHIARWGPLPTTSTCRCCCATTRQPDLGGGAGTSQARF